MKRQTIYAILIVALAGGSVSQAEAQTVERGVSEARIRMLQAPDGPEKAALQFGPEAVQRVEMRSITSKLLVSPGTPQDLRKLIFKDGTPPGAKGATLRAAGAPRVLKASDAVKLPSELPMEEAADTMGKEASPVQAPPTQGNAKEVQ